MRVALTQHLDRSPDKLLLKGTVGRIHSWQWAENDRLPSVIYVKFDGATWKLDGMDEPGVYPIRSLNQTWFLDSKRSSPVLGIKRQQFPLTPAYAMTAHASQGKTLTAVLLDLAVDKRVDATFGAVAASRVRSRYDCLILRPFPRWLFNRGVSEGPKLLLQKLRGEPIDWAAFREGRAPVAACTRCQQVRALDAFEHEQWEKVRVNMPAMCMQCKHGDGGPKKRKLDKGTMKYVCSGCKMNKIEDAYPRAQLKQEDKTRKCLACCKAINQLQCSRCGQTKAVDNFHPSMITLPSEGVACKICQEEMEMEVYKPQRKNWFTCRACRQVLPIAVCKEQQDQRRCLNCASRGTRQKDEQTCRNKNCKKKFHEKQQKGQERKRFCPECRRK